MGDCAIALSRLFLFRAEDLSEVEPAMALKSATAAEIREFRRRYAAQ